MSVIHTKIGEHCIQIVCSSDKLNGWLIKNFPMEASPGVKPHLFVHITEGYGVPFVNYNVTITKDEHTISFHRADYRIEANMDYSQATVHVHDELALKHALMNLYSSYAVYHQWGLLIHSSCVIDKIKAHMFAGHSGAGKSTAARLSQPRELLSDEATVVKITSHQITIYNSPFRSEIEMTGAQEPSPLGSIHLLKQAPFNQSILLSKTDGLLHLMDKVFYWSHSPEETSNILILLQRLVKNTPVYELHFQKNPTFWEMIS